MSKELTDRIAELEQQLNTSNACLLQAQNAAIELAAAIEVKDAALSTLLEWCVCQDSKFYKPAEDAMRLQSSPDLLAKRDAALLHYLSRSRLFQQCRAALELHAKQRLSGEWNPTLEIKL